MEPAFKLTHSQVEGGDLPVVWPHLYNRVDGDGWSRFDIAPREDPLGLLLALAGCIGPDVYLLYVLTAARNGVQDGRYESPPMQVADVGIFLSEFTEFLERDGRHSLWIGSVDGPEILVYDDHGLLYVYGPLDEFEQVLTQRGLEWGEFSLPAPHGHNFHARFDDDQERLLERFDWHRTDLRDEDLN